MIRIFTDGSCYNKLRVGGWAVYVEDLTVLHKNNIKDTTISRMEMTAMLWALKQVIKLNDNALIVSDSEFVIKSMKWWLHNWVADGSYKTRVNNDIWVQMVELVDKIEEMCLNVQYYHIRGHQKDFSNPLILGNNVADYYCQYNLKNG